MIISVTVIIIYYYGFNVMIVKLIRGLLCIVFSQKTNSSHCQHMRVPTEHDDREEGKNITSSNSKLSQSSYSCCNCTESLILFLKAKYSLTL